MINTNQQYNLQVHIVDTLGNTYPISSENVLSLTMTESILDMIPKFDMTIRNAGGFMEGTPLTDKMMVRIVLESPNRTVTNLKDDTNYVNSTFIISSYYAMGDPSENKFITYKISGYLAYPNVAVRFSSYKGSSDQAIAYIANTVNITPDIRATGGESISWIQNNNSLNFLYHVAERSYIPNDGVFVYITLDNKLVYTSMYTEISKEPTKRAIYSRNKSVPLQDDTLMLYDGYTIANNTSIYNNTMLYGYQYMYFDGDKMVTPTIRVNEKMTKYHNRSSAIPESAITNFEDYGIIADDRFKNTIFKGKLQNDYYKHLLFSNTVELSINNATHTYLFDKITVNFNSTISNNTVSQPYSGDYVVGAITHSISRDIPYSKKVILCRYGINDYDNVFVKGII